MCFVLTPLIAMGMSLASSAVSYMAQSASADAQRKHQEAFAARNSKMARDSASQQYSAQAQKLHEEAAAAGATASKVTKEALAARARLRGGTVGTGVGGEAADVLIRDFERQEGEYIYNSELNLAFKQQAASLDRDSIRLGLEGRLLAASPDYIPGPNMFASMFSGAMDALSLGMSVDSHNVHNGGESFFFPSATAGGA